MCDELCFLQIQKALEIVANKSSSPIKSDSTVTVQSNLPYSGSCPELSQSSAEDVADRLNAFRGIPSSLLERVCGHIFQFIFFNDH